MVDGVRESYNKICGQWSDFCSSRKVNKCIEDFAELLKTQCKILDVGCGIGFPIDNYLAKRGFLVTGIDISEEMIKRAESLNLPKAKFLTEYAAFYSRKRRRGNYRYDVRRGILSQCN